MESFIFWSLVVEVLTSVFLGFGLVYNNYPRTQVYTRGFEAVRLIVALAWALWAYSVLPG